MFVRDKWKNMLKCVKMSISQEYKLRNFPVGLLYIIKPSSTLRIYTLSDQTHPSPLQSQKAPSRIIIKVRLAKSSFPKLIPIGCRLFLLFKGPMGCEGPLKVAQ